MSMADTNIWSMANFRTILSQVWAKEQLFWMKAKELKLHLASSARAKCKTNGTGKWYFSSQTISKGTYKLLVVTRPPN